MVDEEFGLFTKMLFHTRLLSLAMPPAALAILELISVSSESVLERVDPRKVKVSTTSCCVLSMVMTRGGGALRILRHDIAFLEAYP